MAKVVACRKVTATEARKYLKQAHRAKDKSAVNDIYREYRKAGGKLPKSKAVK
jgi:hypothetical protein